MKLAFTKVLGQVITIVSMLLIGISLLGILNLAFPEYSKFVMDLFGFDNKNEMAFLTMGTAGTGTIGLIGRTLKNSFNNQNAMLVATHNQERALWKKEKEELFINQNEFMEEFVNKQREQLDNDNELIKKQNLVLDFNVAYAKERLKMSDNLVPLEVKQEYQLFLDNVENKDNEIKEVEPLIVVEEIEKVIEIELTPKEVKDKKKAKANNKNRIGVR